MDDLFTYPWPSWKFGLKKEDLFSTLDSQYNTFSFRIQDPQAFHHDVCEISNAADTTEELHRLLAERREKRLAELQSSLMSLSMEIIGNPRLMDSEHWDYACQLFRTRSFDSLVRFFGSYLPDHSDEYSTASVISSSRSSRSSLSCFSDASTAATSRTIDDVSLPMFGKADPIDSVIIHEEPEQVDDFYDDIYPAEAKATMQFDLVVPASPVSTEASSHDSGSTRAPSPSLSYSGESETAGFTLRSLDREAAQKAGKVPTGYATPASSTSGDAVHIHEEATICHSIESCSEYDEEACETQNFDDDDFLFQTCDDDSINTKTMDQPLLTTPSKDNTPLDSNTTTPNQNSIAASYLEYKSAAARRRPSPLRRSASPEATTRRSPDESLNKISKPLSNATRMRTREKKQAMK